MEPDRTTTNGEEELVTTARPFQKAKADAMTIAMVRRLLSCRRSVFGFILCVYLANTANKHLVCIAMWQIHVEENRQREIIKCLWLMFDGYYKVMIYLFLHVVFTATDKGPE